MKKTVKLWLALALMIVMGSTQAWAIKNSYTIQFKNSGTWTDASTSVSTIDDIVSSGAWYVSEIPAAQVSRVFNAANDADAIRLGAAAGGGKLALKLKDAVMATKIKFEAKQFDENEKAITVNGKEFKELTAGWVAYEIELDGKTALSQISIESSARAYIGNVTVEYDVDKLYIVGIDNWLFSEMKEMTYNSETKAFEYSFKTENYSTYFTLTDMKNFYEIDEDGNEKQDWGALNNHRYGIGANDQVVDKDAETAIDKYDYATLVLEGAGEYKLSIAKETMKLKVEYIPAPQNLTVYGSSMADSKYDIAAYIEKVIADNVKADKNYRVGDLNITLNSNQKYTISKTINVPGNLTFNGNGYTVTVAEDFTGDIFTLTGTEKVAMKADGETASDHKYIGQINLNSVIIKGVKGALIKDTQKTMVENLQIINSIVEMPAAGKNVLDFNGKGYAAYVYVYRSTIYAKGKNTGFFAQYGSRPKNLWTKDADGKDFAGNYDQQTFNVQNSTFVNIANNKNFTNLKQQGTAQNIYTIKNNIFVDCGKNGQVVVGFNGGQTSATPKWNVDGNTFNWGGADVAAAEATKAGKKDDEAIVKNSVVGVVPFKDAAEGDFTIEEECLQKMVSVGDPRWITLDIDYNSPYADVRIGQHAHGSLTRNYYSARPGQPVIATVSAYDGYEVKDVTVVPDGSWDQAKAPQRAAGIMQEFKATKVSDTKYAFYMPRANVTLNVNYLTIVQDEWITIADVEPIDQNFEGELKPEVTVEDQNVQLEDEDGNPLWKDEDETEPLYKVLKEGVDYTLEYKDNTKAGTATVVITGIGDYTGTAEATFTIVKIVDVETPDLVAGNIEAVVISDEEDNKTCVIVDMTPNDGEETFTVPAELAGYTVIGILDGAVDMDDFKNITDIYLPAIGEDGEGIIAVPENALLPAGFTHPKDMFTVHVPLQVLDDYANEAGLKKFAKYSHLVAEVTIPESGYATFSTGIPVQFDEDVVVNYVVNYSAEAVKKQAAKNNMVKAFTGVLLYGEPGEHTVYAINDNTQIEDVDENLLEAVTIAANYDADDADYSYFILKDGKFYAIADNNNEVPSCKAVLKIAKTEAAAAALVLDIIDGISTGIRSIDAANLKDGQLYDLNGRKVSKAQKGVFILNGKKVVVK